MVTGVVEELDRVADLCARLDFTVSEAEKEVPAGKYKALEVAGPDFEIGGRKMAMTSWYAPGVGMIAQRLEVLGVVLLLELEKLTPGE